MTFKLSSYVTDRFRLILQNFQAAFGGQKKVITKKLIGGALCAPPPGQVGLKKSTAPSLAGDLNPA